MVSGIKNVLTALAVAITEKIEAFRRFASLKNLHPKSLRFAEQEVNPIASLYSTQPLVGAAATESAVFSQAGRATTGGLPLL
jgi:hypothetical protein